MSYENLLTDTCDIFHLKTRPTSGGNFGISPEDRQEEYYYENEPDVKEQSCYFIEKSQNITQSDPNKTITQAYDVHFPVDADVRIDSKIAWDGVTLKAQKPNDIKGHHQEVVLIRSDNL